MYIVLVAVLSLFTAELFWFWDWFHLVVLIVKPVRKNTENLNF